MRTAYPALQRLANLLEQSLAKSFAVIKRLLTVLLQETITHRTVDIWCQHSLVIINESDSIFWPQFYQGTFKNGPQVVWSTCFACSMKVLVQWNVEKGGLLPLIPSQWCHWMHTWPWNARIYGVIDCKLLSFRGLYITESRMDLLRWPILWYRKQSLPAWVVPSSFDLQ